MKPFDPLYAQQLPPSSEVYPGEAKRRAFYSALAAQCGPPDTGACIEHVFRTYGLGRRGR